MIDQSAIDHALRCWDIDPDVVDLLATKYGKIRPVPDQPGAFEIPCRGFPDEPELLHSWTPFPIDPKPWGAPHAPALWLPVGADKTAIVCVGAASGLALTSLLLSPALDGSLQRRGHLPRILETATPVVLPETHRAASPVWIEDKDSANVLADWLHEGGVTRAFLAMVRRPAGLDVDVDGFVSEFIQAGKAAEPPLTVVPLMLEGEMSLPDVYRHFHGYGRIYALAGALELAAGLQLAAERSGKP